MAEQDDTNPNDWMRDRNLTKYIMQALEETDDPDYIYTISVQGHGDYPEEPMIDNPKIKVSGGSSQAENYKWEYYCNQIYEMDQFVKELTDTLSKWDEDVVLVMYGDHLPTMGLNVTDVENKYLFQTEYVIWDNMGLEKKDKNLAAYQMAAEVMDQVGIHEGNVFRFHQARRNTKNYQVDLESLQYDILYGDKYVYDGTNPFERVKTNLGVKNAELHSIEKIAEAAIILMERTSLSQPFWKSMENFMKRISLMKKRFWCWMPRLQMKIRSMWQSGATVLLTGCLQEQRSIITRSRKPEWEWHSLPLFYRRSRKQR